MNSLAFNAASGNEFGAASQASIQAIDSAAKQIHQARSYNCGALRMNRHIVLARH